MATNLTVQTIPLAGLAPTMSAASTGAGANTFTNAGNETLIIKNADTNSITVTLLSLVACDQGVGGSGTATANAHDIAITIAAGVTKYVKNINPARFNDSTGVTSFTVTGAADIANVTLALVR